MKMGITEFSALWEKLDEFKVMQKILCYQRILLKKKIKIVICCIYSAEPLPKLRYK